MDCRRRVRAAAVQVRGAEAREGAVRKPPGGRPPGGAGAGGPGGRGPAAAGGPGGFGAPAGGTPGTGGIEFVRRVSAIAIRETEERRRLRRFTRLPEDRVEVRRAARSFDAGGLGCRVDRLVHVLGDLAVAAAVSGDVEPLHLPLRERCGRALQLAVGAIALEPHERHAEQEREEPRAADDRPGKRGDVLVRDFVEERERPDEHLSRSRDRVADLRVGGATGDERVHRPRGAIGQRDRLGPPSLREPLVGERFAEPRGDVVGSSGVLDVGHVAARDAIAHEERHRRASEAIGEPTRKVVVEALAVHDRADVLTAVDHGPRGHAVYGVVVDPDVVAQISGERALDQRERAQTSARRGIGRADLCDDVTLIVDGEEQIRGHPFELSVQSAQALAQVLAELRVDRASIAPAARRPERVAHVLMRRERTDRIDARPSVHPEEELDLESISAQLVAELMIVLTIERRLAEERRGESEPSGGSEREIPES